MCDELVTGDVLIGSSEGGRETRAGGGEGDEAEVLEQASRADIERVGDHERPRLVQRTEAIAEGGWCLVGHEFDRR